MKIEIEDGDCVEIKDVLTFMGLEPLPDNDTIRTKIGATVGDTLNNDDRPLFLGLAWSWSWHDTEVRAELCELFGAPHLYGTPEMVTVLP